MKKRLVSLFLALALCLCVPAFAAETADEIDPSLRLMAELIADWDESYELPDLDALSPEDRETVKALVDAILLAREAQPETEPESVPETAPEPQPETQPETQDEVALTISFSDVPTTHTFYKGIMYCAGKGIVNGYADGTFWPANTVTRANFAVMLARAFYPTELEWYNPEKNLKYGYAAPAFATLNSKGLLAGTNFDTTAKFINASIVNTGINRYDMAQLMTNIMKAKGFAASASQKTAIQSKITDYKNIPSQYQDAVKNVYALGIISGYSDGRFVGTNIMNRGQAAIVIQRMAQYAPVTGDKDNDQYDDGTSQKPEVKPEPKPEPTPDPKPVETPTPEPKPEEPAALTLRDGSAPTPANALKIINEILKVYPNGTTWGTGNTGRRNAYIEINGRKLGDISTAMTRIGNKHAVSMSGGCGGFASLVSDAIFGGRDNSGENFPMRQLSSVSQVRPGDVIVKLDENGKIDHVLTAASNVKSTTTANGVTRYCIGIYDGNVNGAIRYVNRDNLNYLTDTVYRGSYYVAYTRYPD